MAMESLHVLCWQLNIYMEAILSDPYVVYFWHSPAWPYVKIKKNFDPLKLLPVSCDSRLAVDKAWCYFDSSYLTDIFISNSRLVQI